ncbi:hypothetical protein [uncultured Methylobacterium sp.]|uniref:hypothetical protein n=1 Tax=uncultured Methylobacterium sp. TaxID=157278 RepID=UPI0035CB63B3
MTPDAPYRVPNNAGWYRSYALQRRAAIAPPWAGTPAWAAGAACLPGMARVYAGDLYLVRPDLTAGFTAAASFEADVDAARRPLWLRVGLAESYAAVPIDLTGAALTLALKAIDAAGAITDPRPKLICGTADGCLAVTNARLGGVAEAIPRERARRVPAGTYAFDVVATYPDGRAERVKFGPLIVQQGICP